MGYKGTFEIGPGRPVEPETLQKRMVGYHSGYYTLTIHAMPLIYLCKFVQEIKAHKGDGALVLLLPEIQAIYLTHCTGRSCRLNHGFPCGYALWGSILSQFAKHP
jgi:hypothetical protein